MKFRVDFNGNKLFSLMDILGYAFYTTNLGENYISKRDADYEGIDSTSSLTWKYMNSSESIKISNEAIDTSMKAIDMLCNITPSNSFESELCEVVRMKEIPSSNFGLAVAIVPWYVNRLKKEEELKNAPVCTSVYVGNIGDKIEIHNADIRCVYTCDSQFGLYKIFEITDNNGNIFTWGTTSYVEDSNGKISLKGTIKEHKEYKGKKQTVLTRCKVI